MSDDFEQLHLAELQKSPLDSLATEGGRTFLKDGSFESPNFRTGQKGWKVTSEGDAEFQALTIAKIDIGGSDSSSFHVDINGNLWLGAATLAAAPFQVSNTGVLTSANLTRLGGLYTRTNVTGSSDFDILTLSIAGNLLGTKGSLRITTQLTNNAGGTYSLKYKYGGTQFASLPMGGGVGTLSKQVVDITNLNATNSQVSSGFGLQVAPTISLASQTGTIDTTSAQNLVITVVTDGGSMDNFVEYIFVELIV